MYLLIPYDIADYIRNTAPGLAVRTDSLIDFLHSAVFVQEYQDQWAVAMKMDTVTHTDESAYKEAVHKAIGNIHDSSTSRLLLIGAGNSDELGDEELRQRQVHAYVLGRYMQHRMFIKAAETDPYRQLREQFPDLLK